MKTLSSEEIIKEYEQEEIPRASRQKISKKPKTKKADHKHIYEPVIFTYKYNFAKERLFYSAGRRCSICSKLDYGFPDAYKKEKGITSFLTDLGIERETFLENNEDNLPVIFVNNPIDLKIID